VSSLDFLKPIIHLLPEVKSPEKPVPLNEKLMWTGAALILFFVMYHTLAIGVRHSASGLDFLQVVTASRIGSLLTVGIGPIVLASIFLQLFVGAKIINLDMTDPEQRKTFHGAQKILAILLCFFEAAVFVMTSRVILAPLFPGMGEGFALDAAGNQIVSAPYTEVIVILQIALGSLILLFLDEVVSKHGIGSGVSLFIAAGVALSIVGGTISLFMAPSTGVVAVMQSGGAEAIPLAIMALLPIFFTLVVFVVVVYAEGIKVEIPLAFERARGIGGGFPIKLMYVSNIPVILASALLLNMQLFSIGLNGKNLCVGGVLDEATGSCGAGINLVHILGVVDSSGQLRDGLLYLISPIYRPIATNYGAYANHLLFGTTPAFGLPEMLHVICYILFMVVLCVIFGKFWVETANMDAKSVATQLDKSGLQVPGFRRDPRVVEKVLERYIPTITILGSIFVGLLAGFADLLGALGTGTGILLTVGILYKMYQDLENQRLFETNPMLASMLGED
jgi:preprotein translocase subunit SecY